MPYSVGGRADKNGNRYEIRWMIYQLLDVVKESIQNVTLEALGDEEKGVDLVIELKDGVKEYQQCKGRNGSEQNWTLSGLNKYDLLAKWSVLFNISNDSNVGFVTPLSFPDLEDLIDRARNTGDDYENFYKILINKSNNKFANQYEYFCLKVGLDTKNEQDIIKSINYLRRIHLNQYPDSSLKQIITDRLELLFEGDPEKAYNYLVSMIIDGNILGTKIDAKYIYDYLKNKEINPKNLYKDNRIIPIINQLNQEYKNTFFPINNRIIEREETKIALNSINNGCLVMLHGKAGNGKSGVTQEIIKSLEKESVLYLAVKLDKKIPNKNADLWSKDLGLSASLVYCIHSLSKEKKSVIILDQLDALRWTQSHSRDSLLVCDEIINQVIRINKEREKKISVLFVCRTYDYENDKNIKNLFSKNYDNHIVWKEIKVDVLSMEDTKKIIGKSYDTFSNKLKELLRIPSNLFIWQKLDKSLNYDDCLTSSHLISKWWEQILKECHGCLLNEEIVTKTKDDIVYKLNNLGRISINKSAININETALDYLSSNGFIFVDQNTISFSHQSLLDYFLSDTMVKRYYNNDDVLEMIGDKEKQTPGKRYQIQMFMQSILESNTEDFIVIGKKILESSEIRYYVKYIFFELLSQIERLDDYVKKFILEYLKKSEFRSHIINNVILGNYFYTKFLLDQGILEDWIRCNNNKEIGFTLLARISPNYDDNLIQFIREHSFFDAETDRKLFNCFSRDINEDTDNMFDLRMEFYSQYPEFAEEYIDFKKMMSECQIRTIRLLDFWLLHKTKTKKEIVYRYADELLDETDDIFITNAIELIQILIRHIPRELEHIRYSDWGAREYNKGLERTCVHILKKANHALIEQNASEFLRIYCNYFGKGYLVYNELILDGLKFMPEIYSDIIVNYLSSDIDIKYFESSSEEKNELALVKDVLEKHTKKCSDASFEKLENAILNYCSHSAVERYRRRIEYNKSNNEKVYWSFWGDLQYEVLSILPTSRLSNNSKNLLEVLKRKFYGQQSIYDNFGTNHFGSVWSPISGKSLSNRKWKEIIKNNLLCNRRLARSKQVPGGFVSSSIEDFCSDFRIETSKEPMRMIKIALNSKETIKKEFVDSLFEGIAISAKINEISVDLIDDIFKVFKYDLKSHRASLICSVIEKKRDANWSNNTILMLKDIAENHNDPDNIRINVTTKDDKEMKSFDMLQSNAINCVRGNAAEAIGSLLWNTKEKFVEFKGTINKLINDKSPAVQYASLYAVWPIYNIDKEWASEKIIELFEKDVRFSGFPESRKMFYFLYPNFKDRILHIIRNCFNHDDKYIVEIGSYAMTEAYITKKEFEEEFSNTEKFSETQTIAIIHMTVNYFDDEKYNEICKEIILKFIESEYNVDNCISKLFFNNLINLDRDKQFLKDILSSKLSRKIVHDFIEYLDKQTENISYFSEIIFVICEGIMNDVNFKDEWWISDDLSKLIISLYDETSDEKEENQKKIAYRCLDIWDKMFEKQIGSTRKLSQLMLLK